MKRVLTLILPKQSGTSGSTAKETLTTKKTTVANYQTESCNAHASGQGLHLDSNSLATILFGVLIVSVLGKQKPNFTMHPKAEDATKLVPIPVITTDNNFTTVLGYIPLTFAVLLYGGSAIAIVYVLVSPVRFSSRLMSNFYNKAQGTGKMVATQTGAASLQVWYMLKQLPQLLANLTVIAVMPSIVTEKMLLHTQEVIKGESAVIEYLMKAVNLQNTAEKFGIILTKNNNGSFIVNEDGSLVIDLEQHELIQKKVLNKIAELSNTKVDYTNSYFSLPGAEALEVNRTLLRKIWEAYNATVSKILYVPPKMVHELARKVLNSTLVPAVGGGVMAIGVNKVIDTYALNPVLHRINSFFVRQPNVAMKLKRFFGRLFTPRQITSVETLKCSLLQCVAPREGQVRTLTKKVLKTLPDNYIELVQLLVLIPVARSYVKAGCNLLLIQLEKQIANYRNEILLKTPEGRQALDLRDFLRGKGNQTEP